MSSEYEKGKTVAYSRFQRTKQRKKQKCVLRGKRAGRERVKRHTAKLTTNKPRDSYLPNKSLMKRKRSTGRVSAYTLPCANISK